jgi:NAD(P)-dependent dehydrogenase (short-subunit alcohol dehydrogenase family)
MKVIPDVSDRPIAELVSLQGRRAVVTGGGRGLGKAIARRLAEAGADVLIGDVDEGLAAGAARDLDAAHASRVIGTRMDVTDTESVKAAIELACRAFGGLDIWVNNAGIYPNVPVLEMSDALWDKVFAVNVRGLFAGSREAARKMIDAGSGGVIVNIVSTAGFRGVAPGVAAYVGSKHAVRGVTKQMALELAPHGIRVLGVAPTFCETEGNLAALEELAASSDRDIRSEIAASMTSRLGRVGAPDDIARVVLFCASDLAAFMTGSTLLADAGETI